MPLLKIKMDGLDWDQGNINKIEQRVPITLIENFFQQTLLIQEDTRHSLSEIRYLAIGQTQNPKRFLIVASVRTKGAEKLIRPISARFMHKKEEQMYEKEIKKLQSKQP